VAADRGERENGSACRKAEGSIPKARLRKPRHNLTPTQPHALCTLHRVDKQQVGEQEGKMAAAVEEELIFYDISDAKEELLFYDMSDAERRQWVEANPGRVNHRDSVGYTLLTAAALKGKEEDGLLLTFIVWLLDE